MIDHLQGVIHSIEDLCTVVTVGGIGFGVLTPHATQLSIGSQVSLLTYCHWSAENGPSLFGFPDAFHKRVFLLLLDVPKIGPKIAISVLSQRSPYQIIEAISTQNEQALSCITGIGPKKAEQIIMQLKDKVSKLMTSGEFSAPEASLTHWHHLGEALLSLGYTKPEISRAVEHLTKASSGKEITFDKLLRSALAHLSKTA